MDKKLIFTIGLVIVAFASLVTTVFNLPFKDMLSTLSNLGTLILLMIIIKDNKE